SNLPAVRFPRHVAIARNAVGGAIGKETTFNAGIRPIESVDAQSLFTRRQAERHRNEKAAFESTDFDEVPANAERRLPSDKVPADGRREAGGHAAHPLVALRKVEIDGGVTARDVKHQTMLSARCANSPRTDRSARQNGRASARNTSTCLQAGDAP